MRKIYQLILLRLLGKITEILTRVGERSEAGVSAGIKPLKGDRGFY